MMGREQLLPHLLVIKLLLLFLQKGESLFVAKSMPILLKHLMLKSLVLRVLRSLAFGPRSLPPRTLSTAQEGRELPLPSIPVGGRLSQFSTQWEKRTSDPWVLSIIWGGRLELQFKQLPPLSESPIPFSVSWDPHKLLRLSEEVSVLLQKAAIEQVPTSSLGPGFYSRLLVPQEKGGNETSYRSFYFEYLPCGPHFKMETNRSIREIPSLRVGQQSFFSFELSHSG